MELRIMDWKIKMNEINKNNNYWGIFLKLYLPKETIDIINTYEKVMGKIIRKWKDKYNMKEYAACLEKSNEGFLHVHIYINQFMPLKEINEQWCNLIGVKDLTKGNLYMTIVESEEHKTNILSYIWKAPLRTWICQEYKNKYGWKTGNINNKLEIKDDIITEVRTIATGFEDSINEEQKSVKLNINKKMAENENLSLKNNLIIGEKNKQNFNSAEYKRDEYKIYKKQIDLEKNLIILNSIESLKKEGGRNYKMKLNVLKGFIPYIKEYVIFEQISKNMSDKRKEIMLLNMVYIAFQLENSQGSNYIYYKIGEKLFKYYDLNKQFITHIIEIGKNNIKDIKKITKKEWKFLYINFYKSEKYKEYKEMVLKLGLKFFNIFKDKFYDIKKVLYKNKIINRLVLKEQIKQKIKKIIDVQKIYKYKYKIPLIEKPIEWGPNLEDYGGWHSPELRKSLIKENINDGHNLEINYKKIYPIINKLQSIEYTINKDLLNFILKNKDKIYFILLQGLDKESIAYKTKKEQYDIILNLAIYMSNYDKFYFTYEFDYRGRIHIIQEYLNYQGNLLARILIVWKQKKPKNEIWMHIACASLYKGIIGKNYDELESYYYYNIRKWNLLDWEIYIKDAKEPLLWLALFYELKTNETFLTNYIIWFDATCSGSQIISLLTNDDTFLKHLNMTSSEYNKVYDYYTYIYELYGKIKHINESHSRKIIKKTVMTINYGLTRTGCHKKIFILLKEYGYCKDWNDYKENWKEEINKFYNFLLQLPLVKNLEPLQILWNFLCDHKLIYQFVVGEYGLLIDDYNKDDFIFKVKTISYKKYYKNLSLYNKSRKMKEKGFKYLWHHNSIDKREQKRKIKANLIHMLDGTWNILTCMKFKGEIATIHDCHGLHSSDIEEYFVVVRNVFVNLFLNHNQYFYLLQNITLYLTTYLLNLNKNFYKDFYNSMMKEHIYKFYNGFFWNKYKWWGIKRANYLFVPK